MRISTQRGLLVFSIFAATNLCNLPSAAAQTFVDVTAQVGLSTSPVPAFGNPLFGDLNGDGRLDLFLSRHYNGYQLLANNSNGTFTHLAALQYGQPNYDLHAAAMGDFNNDGLLDLFIGYSGAGGTTVGRKRDQLYINRGGSQLPLEVAGLVGMTNPQGRVQCVSVVDIDADGNLDIFVVNRATANLFWRNNGDGTVMNIAPDLGLDDPPTFFLPDGVLGDFACFSDFDLDGDPDLVMTRAGVKLLRNDGSGGFNDVAPALGVAASSGQFSVAWGDYNNDGRPDLFLGGTRSELASNRLYRSNADGTFTDVTAAAGVNSILSYDPRGAAWGDYDNDGDLDLYVVCNDLQLRVNGPDLLYRNNGDGTFTNVAGQVGLTVSGGGRGEGCAWGDFNNDGALDLMVTNGGLISEEIFPEGRDVLYRNTGNSNRWLKIIPEGTISNRSGIGTKVWITAGGKMQFRELTDGAMGKLRTQGLAPLHFGLGTSAQVDLLTIEWPSGLVESHQNLAANQTLRLVEGSAP